MVKQFDTRPRQTPAAIVVGASSGIGRSLARLLAQNGYKVGITGRRTALLEQLRAEDPGAYFIKTFDVCDTDRVAENLEALTAELGGLDLLVLSAGVGDLNPALDYQLEKPAIDTNVHGFTAVCDWAFRYFEQQGKGHLAAITSVAGLRGNRHAPAYNASKAYQINYLEGLRQKATRRKKAVFITDIRPGFIDTEMAKGEGRFWVMPVDKTVRQIFQALKRKRKVVYVTRRWAVVAFLMKRIPGYLYNRM